MSRGVGDTYALLDWLEQSAGWLLYQLLYEDRRMAAAALASAESGYRLLPRRLQTNGLFVKPTICKSCALSLQGVVLRLRCPDAFWLRRLV